MAAEKIPTGTLIGGLVPPEKVPAGYMQDGKGRLVRESMVSDIDKMRDQLVRDLFDSAVFLSEALRSFKAEAFGDIEAFVETSMEQYGVTPRGMKGKAKGSITLYSFDCRYKIVRQMADRLTFDERLVAAKALIDECLTEWSEGSREEIKVLINDAFRVDQQGQVNAGRVLGLRRLKIEDHRWESAMQAISDSITVVGTSSYVRVYERIGGSDCWRAIPLDLAAVGGAA